MTLDDGPRNPGLPGERSPMGGRRRSTSRDLERYAALFRHLLGRGVYVAPSQFEAMFVSLAHSDAEVDRTVEAVGDFYS